MRILITTGIYPPKIGGPAQYAKNLAEAFGREKHSVTVKTFYLEDYLPTGVRHAFFFLKIIPAAISSDLILALDTFSVGLPTVLAGRILSKKVIIRTGGDFLWEQYVERTSKKVLFRNFYSTEMSNFSSKEKLIFKITRWTLHNASIVVFSTLWQRDIFIQAYGLPAGQTAVVENYYGPKESDAEPRSKMFVASSRNLKWKNIDALKRVFGRESLKSKGVELFTDEMSYGSFMDKMRNAYAVILVSLGDISPNLIMDAIRLNRPFICTKETGIFERVKDAGIFVDPLDEEEVEKAVLDLLDTANYEKAREKVRQFSFTHTWKDIGGEFISVHQNLKS